MIAERDTTPDEGAVDLAGRRADVVRRLLQRGVTPETLATIVPDLEPDILAARDTLAPRPLDSDVMATETLELDD